MSGAKRWDGMRKEWNKAEKLFQDDKLSLCFGCCFYLFCCWRGKNSPTFKPQKALHFSCNNVKRLLLFLEDFLGIRLNSSILYATMVKLLTARHCSFSSLLMLCWLIHSLTPSLYFCEQTGKSQTLLYVYIRMTHVSNDTNALFVTFVDIFLYSAFHRRMEIIYSVILFFQTVRNERCIKLVDNGKYIRVR